MNMMRTDVRTYNDNNMLRALTILARMAAKYHVAKRMPTSNNVRIPMPPDLSCTGMNQKIWNRVIPEEVERVPENNLEG